MDLLLCLIFLICVSSQSFENPASNSTILCGFTGACRIICNVANACQAAEFYLYSNDAYVECSGESSCKSLKIISTNATSLTLHINGSNAFLYGIASIQQANQRVITRCVHKLACKESSFYYNGDGLFVDHYCTHNHSCESSLISALPIDQINLTCGAMLACAHMDVYIPINKHHSSGLNMNILDSSTHIYSMHGFYNLDIMCNEHCIDTNQIYIIYGKEYESYCRIYDEACIQSDMQSVAIGDDIVIVYSDDANYHLLDLEHTEIILFMLHSLNIQPASDTIASSALSTFIHVICVDQIRYPSCNNMHFNFSLSNNASITANNAHSITIIGPSNNFKRNAYRDNNNGTRYYLEATPFISLHCNQLSGGQCLYNSVLYTESPTNLQILCGANDCHYADVYTTIDPTQSTSMLNIICYPYITSCAPQFYLHFANNITCNTPYDPHCVSFLSSSPTSNPSISPIVNPTVIPSISTISPSISPSVSPSIHPSLTSLSPSVSPTFNPTFSPTLNPTSMPSNSPTISPSLSPTYNPTLSPSNAPIAPPTNHPTLAPSLAPTLQPTNIPTLAPSHSPTKPPTNYPTFTPTNVPTAAPSYLPTNYPTLSPTNIPTLAPSFSPTKYPTFSPTIAPSVAPSTPPTNAPTMPPTKTPTAAPSVPPTNAPTESPTLSPTDAPTRHPTQDIYTNTIYIDYWLNNITYNISAMLYDSAVQSDLQQLFEYCYLETYKVLIQIQDKNETLHYRDFHLVIVEVQPSTETNVMRDIHHRNHTSILKANIFYADPNVGDSIRFISRRSYFRNLTQYKLNAYFKYKHLQLIVGDPWEAGDDNTDRNRKIEIEWFFILITSIGFICVIIAISSFIYNNWPACAWTDNGNSVAMPLYGMQMVDFFTDINLCVEMFLHFSETEQERIDHGRGSPSLLWLAAWGALTFTVIPYVTNLVLAAGIKNVKEIKENVFAKSYFQTGSWFFIVLVVFSGAVYPALSIVSSRLFAFEFLNSGLTMMELTLLTRWRLHLTILLENIPQLMCSVLYILYLGTPTSNTILAMIVSSLQIIATVTNYVVTYRPSDCRAIEYDLQMEIYDDSIRRSKSNLLRQIKSKDSIKSNTAFTETSEMDLNDIEEDSDEEEYEAAIHRKYGDIFDVESTSSTLTKEQKTQIQQRKERKASLRRSICTELSLRLNAIEIGYITLTPNGCIIHVIHYTFESEAKAFHDQKLLKRLRLAQSVESDDLGLEHIAEQAMLKSPSSLVPLKSDGHDRWEGDARSLEKTAKALFKDLYRRKSNEVECALASHFGFRQDAISVTYHKGYPYTSWDMISRDRFSYRNLGEARYHPIAQLSHINIETPSIPISNPESVRSPTDEAQESTDQILVTLMIKMREKLMHSDKDTVKRELFDEGYNEKLIERVFEMGQLLATMSGTIAVQRDISIEEEEADTMDFEGGKANTVTTEKKVKNDENEDEIEKHEKSEDNEVKENKEEIQHEIDKKQKEMNESNEKVKEINDGIAGDKVDIEEENVPENDIANTANDEIVENKVNHVKENRETNVCDDDNLNIKKHENDADKNATNEADDDQSTK